MFESQNEFSNLQDTAKQRRDETRRELQELLTQYLGREGIRYQCMKAEKQRLELAKISTKTTLEMQAMNLDCKSTLKFSFA